ncbi:hypothetical protein T11_7566, partial [Trichinella zimbabwensis]
MLGENSRKREKEGADSLAENFSVLDKNGVVVQRKTAMGRTKSVPSSWLENGTA